jgi:hypothetical protein
MKTSVISRTLLCSILVIAAAMNLQCNKLSESGKSGSGAKPEAFSSVSAYIGVYNKDIDDQAMMEALTRTYAHLAMAESVLRRAINEDKTEDGRNRDRIRNTSCFTGDLIGTIKNIQKRLTVSAVPGTTLMRVSLDFSKPEERCEIINAIADAIIYNAAQRHRQMNALRLRNLSARHEALQLQIAAKRKQIVQIRGRSEVPLMTARRTLTQDSLTTLTHTLTSLRIQKARADADMDSFKEEVENKTAASSSEIQSAISSDPDVATLRAALLQSKIRALGDPNDKKLGKIQKQLAVMLTEKESDAARQTIKRKSSKLETEITTISEQLLATGNHYNEESERLRDITTSLTKIEIIQSEIDRIEQRTDELDDIITELRIQLGDMPLMLNAPAEIL